MCGIAGIVDLECRPIDAGLLCEMNRAIEHRGPDDEGYVLVDASTGRWQAYAGEASQRAVRDSRPLLDPSAIDFAATIGLAHRRFSIIDLTAGGHQPLSDHDGRCSIVLNGEIYNYVELREELENAGHLFLTESDTEVLLEAYKEWGIDCLTHLNGFWSFALYDFPKRRLILSRDRLGKKPLYWVKKGSRLYFASEIKALLRVPEVAAGRRVNEQAAYLWLVLGLKDLDESTFFEGVSMFPSASWTDVDAEFPSRLKTFWHAPAGRLKESDVSVGEASRAIREDTLQDAVRIRLRADVPWCVELSGGMDSSALVAIAARLSESRVRTCTARFGETEANEEPFAKLVTERYGADQQLVDAQLNSFWSNIGAFTRLEEEPYHSPNLQTNQVLWGAMRGLGVKVSLNGAGGDELFAGYTNYFYQAQTELLRQGRIGHFLANARNWSEDQDWARAMRIPIANLLKDSISSFLPARVVTKIKRIRRRLDFVKLASADGEFFYHTLSKALLGDLQSTKIPYWLRSGDKGFMGVPLRVRAPFLDYRMVELAFKLPMTYLIRDGWHKWILRVALEDLLPREVVWRKRKVGFPFPAKRFYSESRSIINVILGEASNPYLDGSKSVQFRDSWQVLSFLLWYEMFFNQNESLFNRIERLSLEQGAPSRQEFSPAFLESCRH